MQGLRSSQAFTTQRVQLRSRTSLNVVCKESRIGIKPVAIPKGVTVDLKGSTLKVKVCFVQSDVELCLHGYLSIPGPMCLPGA